MEHSSQDIQVRRLFGLLRQSLSGTLAEEHLFHDVAQKEWEELFVLSQRNKIAAVMLDGVLSLPLAQQPPRSVMIPWMAECQKAEQAYRYKHEAEQELIRFFKQNGINTLILKGTSVSRYYPRPERRPSSDIDIYQYGRQKEADELIARELGVDVTSDGHHHTKYAFRGVTVESHYEFFNTHVPPSSKGYESLLKAMNPESATFEALLHARHMAVHFVSGKITLRNLCDWAMFLESRRGEVDWKLVSSTFREYGMLPFVAALQYIVETQLAVEPIKELPASREMSLCERVLSDTAYGGIEASDPETPGLERLVWKFRRLRANRWKHGVCFCDPWLKTLLSSSWAHLQKPQTILHKV